MLKKIAKRTGSYLQGNRAKAIRAFWHSSPSNARAYFKRSLPHSIHDAVYDRFGGKYPMSMSYHGNSYLPAEYNCIMRYSEVWNDTTAGGIVDYIYRGNSVFDPYQGAGGSIADGYTQLSTLYGKYKVTYCKVFCTVVNNDSDDPVTLAIVPDTSTTAYTTEAPFSAPCAKTQVVTNQVGKEVVFNEMSTKRMFGPEYNDSTACAAVGANPTNVWYWHIYLKNESTNALNLQLKVDIMYYTTWFSRIRPNN